MPLAAFRSRLSQPPWPLPPPPLPRSALAAAATATATTAVAVAARRRHRLATRRRRDCFVYQHMFARHRLSAQRRPPPMPHFGP